MHKLKSGSPQPAANASCTYPLPVKRIIAAQITSCCTILLVLHHPGVGNDNCTDSEQPADEIRLLNVRLPTCKQTYIFQTHVRWILYKL
jgi:hypothetical protein